MRFARLAALVTLIPTPVAMPLAAQAHLSGRLPRVGILLYAPSLITEAFEQGRRHSTARALGLTIPPAVCARAHEAVR
jgi:hypothetical protein